MATDSTVSDKTICGAICKLLWAVIYLIIQIITYFVALLQVLFCSLFIGLIIIALICLAHKVHSVIRYSKEILFLSSILDDFTGLDIGSKFNREFNDSTFYLFLLLVLLIASCGPLYVSVKLWKGLEKNKEEDIGGYVIAGVTILGVRVWVIESYEYRNFPEDKTVLYCGLYALYLLLLVIVCLEIRKAKRAAIAEIPTASSRIRTFFAAMQTNDGTTLIYGHAGHVTE